MKKTHALLSVCLLIVAFIAILLVPYYTQNAYATTSDIKRYVEESIQNQDIGDRIANDSVIITLSEKASREAKEYSANDFKEVGCTEVEDLTANINVGVENFKRMLKLSLNEFDTDHVINIIKTLNKNEDVLAATPNYIYSVSNVANDTHYVDGDCWGLNGTYGIQAQSAWNITTGGSVTVGVIDTGMQGNHPDLVNRLSTAGLHRDCTVNPIKAVDNQDLTDPNGHGTHVAGIIGAQGNNSIGISGVCWNVKLVSLRVFDKNGGGLSSWLVSAINFAASQNIPILNFSGGFGGEDISVKYALENYQGLFVCAAGNGGDDGIGDDNDLSPMFPSDYSHGQSFSKRVISVGSIDNNNVRSSFSNYGENSVSLFAPGGRILSTYPQNFCTGEYIQTRWGSFLVCDCVWTNQLSETGEFEWVPTGSHHANGYHYMSGTSMATPFVTGVAVLLLAKYPNMTASEIKNTILANVDVDSRLTGLCVAGGRLNAYKALSNPKFKHTHNYNKDYVWLDTKQHSVSCDCGATITQGHAVSANQSPLPTREKLCLFCGGRADYGFVKWEPNSSEVTFVTDNGSFILPNGIFVLVDEDIQAYIDGTLKFHNKNDVTA